MFCSNCGQLADGGAATQHPSCSAVLCHALSLPYRSQGAATHMWWLPWVTAQQQQRYASTISCAHFKLRHAMLEVILRKQASDSWSVDARLCAHFCVVCRCTAHCVLAPSALQEELPVAASLFTSTCELSRHGAIFCIPSDLLSCLALVVPHLLALLQVVWGDLSPQWKETHCLYVQVGLHGQPSPFYALSACSPTVQLVIPMDRRC